MSAPIWRGVAYDPHSRTALYGFVADTDSMLFFPVGGYRLDVVAELQSHEYALGHPGMPGEARAFAYFQSVDAVARHEGAAASVDEAIDFVQQRIFGAVAEDTGVTDGRGPHEPEDDRPDELVVSPGSPLYVAAFLAAHLSICLKRHRTDSLKFGRRYVQWAPRGPGLQVEAVSDRFLDPDQQITAFGAARMRELGFAEPTDDDPNWTMWLDSEVNAMGVAEPIVTALVEVYRVPLEDVAAAVGAFPQPPPARPLDRQEPSDNGAARREEPHAADAAETDETDERDEPRAHDIVYLVWEMPDQELAATVAVRFPADAAELPLVEVFPEGSSPGYRYLFQPWQNAWSTTDQPNGEQLRSARALDMAVKLRAARQRFRGDLDLDDIDSLMAVAIGIAEPTIHMVTVQPLWNDAAEALSELRRWVPADTAWPALAAKEGSSTDAAGQAIGQSDSSKAAVESVNTGWWDRAFDIVYDVSERRSGHRERTPAARVVVSFPAGHRSLPRVEVIPRLSPAGFAYLHGAWVESATDEMVADSETIRRQFNMGFVVLLRNWRSRARDGSWSGPVTSRSLVGVVAVPVLHRVDPLPTAIEFDRVVPGWLKARPTPGQWTRMIAAELVETFVRGERRDDTTRFSAAVLDSSGRQRVLDQVRQRQASSPKIAAAMAAYLDDYPVADTADERSTAGSWLSVVELAPGSDGLGGGPWRVTVTKTNHPGDRHWWPVTQDEDTAVGLSVLRTSGGTVVQVTLTSDLPFQEAAFDHCIDPDVFGSPTLWPGFQLEEVEATGGWVWLHPNPPEPFPFSDRLNES